MGISLASTGLSHPGLQRHTNEDAFWRDDQHCLYVVADGVSESSHGAEASRVAVRAATETLTRLVGGDEAPQAWLEQAVTSANRQVYEKFNLVYEKETEYEAADPSLTTLAIGLVSGRNLHVANVGDSRVYVLHSKGCLEQLTRDDSNAREGYLYRALGHKTVAWTYVAKPIEDCSKILLATDGLHAQLTHEELAALLVQELPISAICEQLVALANKPEGVARQYAAQKGVSFERAQKVLGGRDNITLILAEVRDHALSS
jgi:serine/threonine protein phosphatase PrpC